MKLQNSQKKKSLHTAQLYQNALIEALKKFAPRKMVRNPVMFVVEVVSVLTTGFWVQALLGKGEAPAGFIGHISLWLWFTVLFANYAEALAEGRGKAQAEALKRMRKQTQAKRLPKAYSLEDHGKPEASRMLPGLFDGAAQRGPVSCRGGGYSRGRWGDRGGDRLG